MHLGQWRAAWNYTRLGKKKKKSTQQQKNTNDWRYPWHPDKADQFI